jgi:M6 family metalloprotease-like protein
MRSIQRFGKLWVTLGVFAVAMMLAASVAASESPYPDPPPDFPVIDDSYPHGDLLSPLGGQNDRPVLILYVEFADMPFESNDVPPESRFADFDYMTPWVIHEQYFGEFPSVRGYFEEVSHGTLMLDPVSVDPGANEDGVDGIVQISIDQDRQDWLDSLTTQQEMEFLIREAGSYVNYAQFDNGAGQVTELELSIVRIDSDDRSIPAGGGLVRHAEPNIDIHGITITSVNSFAHPDGYSMILTRTSTNLMTTVHELGHQLFDMPDSYFQEVGNRTDIGGSTVGIPYHLLFRPNAWHAMHLGWAEPTVVTSSGYYDVPVEPAGNSFILYDPDRGTDDYFIVENRAAISGTYDQGVGSTGLMVWRVDESEYRAVGESGWIKLMTGSAINPTLSHIDPDRTLDGLTWLDGEDTDLAIRAISPAGDVMRVYFDVRGPGVLVDPVLRGPSGEVVFYDATPGIENHFPVPVMNTGEATDTFHVFFEGPPGWESIPFEIALDAGEQADAFPAIIPPSDVPVDVYDITVIAQSTSDPAVSEQASLPIGIVLDRTRIEYTGETYVATDQPAGFEAVVTNIDDGDAPVVDIEVEFALTGDGGDLIVTATTDLNGVAQAGPIIDLPPGDYQLTASTDRLGRHQAASTMAAYRIPTAEERVQDLIGAVAGFDLHRGTENGLTSTLGNALNHLENDRSTPGCNVLSAFGNKVNAQDGKHIPEAAAEQFRNEVFGIQNQLGC